MVVYRGGLTRKSVEFMVGCYGGHAILIEFRTITVEADRFDLLLRVCDEIFLFFVFIISDWIVVGHTI